MFEKGMDERMIYYRGKAILGGLVLFMILLIIKDVLIDFGVIRLDRTTTIMDVLLFLIGMFFAMIYMIYKGAIKDSYLLRAWKVFVFLSVISLFFLLPSLFAHRPFIVGNQITMASLKLVQTIIISLFAIFLSIQALRVKCELKS